MALGPGPNGQMSGTRIHSDRSVKLAGTQGLSQEYTRPHSSCGKKTCRCIMYCRVLSVGSVPEGARYDGILGIRWGG
jgi:hypothetical protein